MSTSYAGRGNAHLCQCWFIGKCLIKVNKECLSQQLLTPTELSYCSLSLVAEFWMLL
jgi:hypothetical protein